MSFSVPEKYRIRGGVLGSNALDGNNGAFRLPLAKRTEAPLMIIASDQGGWEHVSVSLPNRCPTWSEMDRVKRTFWDDGDTVMQLHVPRFDHVDAHRYCLHLWRPTNQKIPMPPSWMVGPKELGAA